MLYVPFASSSADVIFLSNPEVKSESTFCSPVLTVSTIGESNVVLPSSLLSINSKNEVNTRRKTNENMR